MRGWVQLEDTWDDGDTALYFDSPDGGGSCWSDDGVLEEFALGCDDPLPWYPTTENPDPAYAQGIACCTVPLE